MDREVRRYRIEMEVPRYNRAGTSWRTLAIRDSYSEAGDLADYLAGSLELAGIERETARAWVTGHLRCVPEIQVTTGAAPEGMPIGP